MIIDTHCHLDFPEFDADREAVIECASRAGVSHFVNVGASVEGSRKSVRLAKTHESIYATVGVHPHYADETGEEAFRELETLVADEKVVAIGEVGLDHFKSRSNPDKQKEMFVKFIELSKKLNLPLVIHTREAHNDTLKILRQKPIRGVMHCFSGDRSALDKYLEMGLFVSFTCNLTFKNAHSLREVAKHVPPERLLLETDCPFLAPQAFRGKRNEPAYITELRDILAQLLNLAPAEIERITTANAKRLFGIAGGDDA